MALGKSCVESKLVCTICPLPSEDSSILPSLVSSPLSVSFKCISSHCLVGNELSLHCYSHFADEGTPDLKEMNLKCLREGAGHIWDKIFFFVPVNTYHVGSWFPICRGGNWLDFSGSSAFLFLAKLSKHD